MTKNQGGLLKRVSRWIKVRFQNAVKFIQALPKSIQTIKIKRPGVAFIQSPSTSVRDATFEGPPVDLEQIAVAYEHDSYVRQAVDKYVDLCFKEGWRILGKNQEALSYIKQRFSYMEFISGQTIDELLIQIVYNLVKYGTAILVKARLPRNGPRPFKAVPIGNKPPIAFYESLNPRTIQVARKENGEPVAFQQDVGNGINPRVFAPDDVIVFTLKREDGDFFGTPWIAPAIEDVKLLRVMESSAENQVRRYVYPIIHAQIGMPEPGYEAEDEDIQKAKEQFEQMPAEGVWVTPERYNIKTVGMEGEVLDISPYLKYMEQRVFTGLGVSETIMGRSGSAARSTALTQAREMFDRVRAIHRMVEHVFNLHVITELLLEGGYDVINNREEYDVRLRFNEIDLDALFKRENNAIYKWEHNAKTFEEMRAEIGESLEVDESRLYFRMVGAVKNSAETDNRQQPANQYGRKTAADSDVANEFKESFVIPEKTIAKLETYWRQMAERMEAISRSNLAKEELSKRLGQEASIAMRLFYEAMKREMEASFFEGMASARSQLDSEPAVPVDHRPPLAALEALVEQDTIRLAKDITARLDEIVRKTPQALIPEKVSLAISSLFYRFKFILLSYVSRAFHAGFAYQAKNSGRQEVHVLHRDDACPRCKSVEVIDLSDYDLIHRLPPFHSGGCRCTLYLPKPSLTDSKEGGENDSPSSD